MVDTLPHECSQVGKVSQDNMGTSMISKSQEETNVDVSVGQNGSWVETSGMLSGSPSFELNVGNTNIPLQSEAICSVLGQQIVEG